MYELYFPPNYLKTPPVPPSYSSTYTMLAADDGKYTFGKTNVWVQRLVETGSSQKSVLCGVDCWQSNHQWSKREKTYRIPVNHVPVTVSTDKWFINQRLIFIQETLGEGVSRAYFECDYPLGDLNLEEVLENYVRVPE
jgi:hypothetical protein